MTKCNIDNGLFQSVKGRKFEVNFDGGNISSDGGILDYAIGTHAERRIF